MPDRTLTSEALIGGKRAKSRITASLCCNADGSDQLLIWFICKFNKPHCFRGINIHTFDLVWRSNKKAWMTGSIFCDWLVQFKSRTVNRKVLLLIDGFSAHQAGIDPAEDATYALNNVRIEFLPPNTTSVCQLLDQGIIRTWNAHYRQQWLRFAILYSVVEAYSEGDRAHETDEEPVEVIQIRRQEAMQAVQLLQRYQ
jgi:DDE superfamily endonuclease